MTFNKKQETSDITENDLSESVEYFVRCSECDAESTRDSVQSFAVEIAHKYGFRVKDNKVYCGLCIR